MFVNAILNHEEKVESPSGPRQGHRPGVPPIQIDRYTPQAAASPPAVPHSMQYQVTSNFVSRGRKIKGKWLHRFLAPGSNPGWPDRPERSVCSPAICPLTGMDSRNCTPGMQLNHLLRWEILVVQVVLVVLMLLVVLVVVVVVVVVLGMLVIQVTNTNTTSTDKTIEPKAPMFKRYCYRLSKAMFVNCQKRILSMCHNYFCRFVKMFSVACLMCCYVCLRIC
jgi:hypothetical protein